MFMAFVIFLNSGLCPVEILATEKFFRREERIS